MNDFFFQYQYIIFLLLLAWDIPYPIATGFNLEHEKVGKN